MTDWLSLWRYTRPLTELLTLAFGPHLVIGEEFGRLDAVAVAIYGSWAARYEGIPGRPPNDIDVLVIGEVARRDLYEAAERAEQRLRLQVNPVLCSRARWIAAADPLIQQIRSAPVFWVTGQVDTLRIKSERVRALIHSGLGKQCACGATVACLSVPIGRCRALFRG